MAVRRDYGSFAKATERILPALVAPHGYEYLGHGFYGTQRSGWLEGFFLQQGQWGGGEFCVNMGIHVPNLSVRWMDLDADAWDLAIAFRLSERGADEGDQWLPATNKAELAQSLETVASWLPVVDPWFAQFQSMLDVARVYRSRTNLTTLGSNEWHHQLNAANYGFLLAEAGETSEARLWLQEAERLMSLPVYFIQGGGMVHEKVKGARLQKASVDEISQLKAVRKSLRELAR